MGDVVYLQIKATELLVRNVSQDLVYKDTPLLLIGYYGEKASVIAHGKEVMSTPKPGSETLILNGFSHPRSIIDDFEVAEKTLCLFLKHVDCRKYSLLPFSPKILIMHPLEKLEGGLTTIEKRALLDMGYRWARKVLVWEGRQLTDQELLTQNFPTDGKLYSGERK